MLADGMRELTPAQLRRELAALGYSIDPALSFSYVNRASPPNARVYRDRHVNIRHTETGLGFAHVKAPRHNLPALQALRQWSFVFRAGRVWSL